MKKTRMIVLIIALSLAAGTVFSQLYAKTTQVTPTIELEETEACETVFYQETENLYGDVTKYRNAYGNCIHYQNITQCDGTGCHTTTVEKLFRCYVGQEPYQSYGIIGEQIATKSKTECDVEKYAVSVDKAGTVEKKELDFSEWGVCIHETENDCLIVTCQSRFDGANDGKFHGCKPGTSCQKFQICDNEIKTFYKNSRSDFIESDPSFFLEKLALKEVPK